MTTSLPLRISLISLLFAAAVAAALTVLGGLFLYQQQQDNAWLHARQASETLADRASQLVALGLRVEDFVGFEEQCQSVIQGNALVRVAALFGSNGSLLYQSGKSSGNWPPNQPLPVSGASTVVSADFGALAVTPVLKPGGGIAAFSVVGIDDTALIATTLSRVGWLLVCALVLFGVGLALQQWIFWRTVGRPLARLVRTADSIQPDNLESTPSLPAGEDDIGRLYQAFSQLMHRLLDARRALLAQNEQLEGAVRERTAELERVNGELAQDIERRKQLEDELRQIANTDVLTGLANRAFMLPYLERQLEQARHGGPRPGLILFDFDGFKGVNDRHGHAVGDRVLQLMAERLAHVCRQDDVLARLGGDEFLVSFNADASANAEAMARRLIAQFEQALEVDGISIKLGVSLGIALYPQHGHDLEALMAAADAAMYAVKAHGGGMRFASSRP